ncbi:hypothetical protein R4I43_32435 [Saccharopolyspora sp. S2-29]|uniref:Uncharacterized protein n=1 Tax=Saccharopolyspora mangrovi TaxID=3082379 RepID=A0ABU6ALC5_9PSEU|nr:hypothetical protein [Saccharopolyspora sp. S2-29]MEB3372120.1 hypothetical protein [Saccharopolyspora sp. S2-29]
MSSGVLCTCGDKRILPARSLASTPAMSKRRKASRTVSGRSGSRKTRVERCGPAAGLRSCHPLGRPSTSWSINAWSCRWTWSIPWSSSSDTARCQAGKTERLAVPKTSWATAPRSVRSAWWAGGFAISSTWASQ